MTARSIESLPKGPDDLFIEPERLTPDVEEMLNHNRERFVHHFNYADPWCGNQKTYDPRGNYICGRCNQATGDDCLLLKIERIDRTAGSCEDWEALDPFDPEMRLKRKSPQVANYGVARNGQGFGCKRCPYAKPAMHMDAKGRTWWCGEGGFHIDPMACCTANGVEVAKAGARAAKRSEGPSVVENISYMMKAKAS